MTRNLAIELAPLNIRINSIARGGLRGTVINMAGEREEARVRVGGMRLVAAQAQGCTQATYGATFGTVEQAGRRWGHCARRQGWSLQSSIHIVADGAEWIRLQARKSSANRAGC